MTSTNDAQPGRTGRKFWLLGLGIVAFVALYTGGWFLGADRLKGAVQDRLSGEALSVACNGLDVKGYPFRIGVFCDTVGIDDRRTGTSASFGALRSAAQVYRPGHAVVELDGPALIRVSPDLTLTADWTLMHASGVAGTGGLQRVSIAQDGLRGTLAAGLDGANLAFLTSHGELHARANGEALDAALSAEGLELDLAGTPVPPLDLALDLTVADAAGWLRDGPPGDAPRGTKGELRNLAIDFGGGNAGTLSGRFEIADDGLISGRFELEVKGIGKVRDILAGAFPDIADALGTIADTIRGLSGGRDEASVKLRVRDGVIYLGIIPIAAIGPL